MTKQRIKQKRAKQQQRERDQKGEKPQKRTEAVKPSVQQARVKDQIDRSTEAAVRGGRIVRRQEAPPDALPSRHTVDSRRRS